MDSSQIKIKVTRSYTIQDVAAVKTLADGKPASLYINGDLSEIADSVNLLLARQIAEAHEGFMKIDAAPGGGCRVTLTFREVSP